MRGKGAPHCKVQGTDVKILKSNFLDNRLPKRKKNDFYSIIVFLTALYVMLLKEPRPTQRLVLTCYDDYAAVMHRDTGSHEYFNYTSIP